MPRSGSRGRSWCRRRTLGVLLVVLGVSLALAQIGTLPVVPPVTPPAIVWDAIVIIGGVAAYLTYQDEFDAVLRYIGTAVVDAYWSLIVAVDSWLPSGAASAGSHFLPDPSVEDWADALPSYEPLTVAAAMARAYHLEGSTVWLPLEGGAIESYTTTYDEVSSGYPARPLAYGPSVDLGMGGAFTVPTSLDQQAMLLLGAMAMSGSWDFAFWYMGEWAIEDNSPESYIMPTAVHGLADAAWDMSADGWAHVLYSELVPGHLGMVRAIATETNGCVGCTGAASYVIPFGGVINAYEPQDVEYCYGGSCWTEVRGFPIPQQGVIYYVVPASVAIAQADMGVCTSGWAQAWSWTLVAATYTTVKYGSPTMEGLIPYGSGGWGTREVWSQSWRSTVTFAELGTVSLVEASRLWADDEGIIRTGWWANPYMHAGGMAADLLYWSMLSYWSRMHHAGSCYGVSGPDVRLSLLLPPGSLLLPWDEPAAPSFGLSSVEATGEPVAWVVNPVAAIAAAFVPTVTLAERVDAYWQSLSTRFPFALAGALAVPGAVGTTAIPVPTLHVRDDLVITPRAETINGVSAIVRVGATIVVLVLFGLWAHRKAFPRTVV